MPPGFGFRNPTSVLTHAITYARTCAMTVFPFPADQIENHRFHGLIQGTFELDHGALRLRTTHGLLRLYPRPGKGGGSAFHAGRKQHQNHPGLIVNAYGYPRTDSDGVVRRLEMMSWFLEGSAAPEGFGGISRKFSPGQLFLCGRVRKIEDGMITVKVKSTVAGKLFRWFVIGQLAGAKPTVGSKTLFAGGLSAGGQLIVRPLQEVSPSVKPGSPRRSAGLRYRERTSASAR